MPVSLARRTLVEVGRRGVANGLRRQRATRVNEGVRRDNGGKAGWEVP